MHGTGRSSPPVDQAPSPFPEERGGPWADCRLRTATGVRTPLPPASMPGPALRDEAMLGHAGHAELAELAELGCHVMSMRGSNAPRHRRGKVQRAKGRCSVWRGVMRMERTPRTAKHQEPGPPRPVAH